MRLWVASLAGPAACAYVSQYHLRKATLKRAGLFSLTWEPKRKVVSIACRRLRRHSLFPGTGSLDGHAAVADCYATSDGVELGLAFEGGQAFSAAPRNRPPTDKTAVG